MPQEFWKVENGRINIHSVTDLTPTFKANQELRKELGNGVSKSKETQAYARVPLSVLLNDPDAKAWFMNGDMQARNRFLAREPRYKCSSARL